MHYNMSSNWNHKPLTPVYIKHKDKLILYPDKQITSTCSVFFNISTIICETYLYTPDHTTFPAVINAWHASNNFRAYDAKSQNFFKLVGAIS